MSIETDLALLPKSIPQLRCIVGGCRTEVINRHRDRLCVSKLSRKLPDAFQGWNGMVTKHPLKHTMTPWMPLSQAWLASKSCEVTVTDHQNASERSPSQKGGSGFLNASRGQRLTTTEHCSTLEQRSVVFLKSPSARAQASPLRRRRR